MTAKRIVEIAVAAFAVGSAAPALAQSYVFNSYYTGNGIAEYNVKITFDPSLSTGTYVLADGVNSGTLIVDSFIQPPGLGGQGALQGTMTGRWFFDDGEQGTFNFKFLPNGGFNGNWTNPSAGPSAGGTWSGGPPLPGSGPAPVPAPIPAPAPVPFKP